MIEQDPKAVAAEIERRLGISATRLSAYWIAVLGNRERYALELREALSESSAIVFVVRNQRFDHPDSVMLDLLKLILENEDTVRQSSAFGRQRAPIAVVLLSRQDFSVPQSPSPLELPEWFPVLGRAEVLATIEDLSWSVNVALDNEAVGAPLVKSALYELEGALLRRLRQVAEQPNGKSQVAGFYSLIQRVPEVTFEEYISRAADAHRLEMSPTGFRPSVRSGSAVVARLWELWTKTAPGSLSKPAKQLARALQVSANAGWSDNLLTVLNRSASEVPTPSLRFCRNLLIVVGSSCQFATSASHASEYGLYPVTQLRSLSLGFQASLAEIEGVLNAS